MKTILLFFLQVVCFSVCAQVFQDIKPFKQQFDTDTEYIYDAVSDGGVGYVSGLIKTDQINLATFIRKVNTNGDSLAEIQFQINQLFTKSMRISDSGNLTVLYGLRNSSRSFMVELDSDLEVISQSSEDVQSLFIEDFIQMGNGQYLLVGDREISVASSDLVEVNQTIEFNGDCRLFLERIEKTADGYALLAEYNECNNAQAPWLDTDNKTLVLLHLNEDLSIVRINYFGEQGDFPEINTRRNSRLYHDKLIVLEDQSLLVSAIGIRSDDDYQPGSKLWLMRTDSEGNKLWSNAVSGRSEGFTDIEILNENYAILTTERRDQTYQVHEVDCEECSGFTAWVGLLDLRSGEIVRANVLDGPADELFSNILKIEEVVLFYGRTSSGSSAGPLENVNAVRYLFQCKYDYTSILPSSSLENMVVTKENLFYPNPASGRISVTNVSKFPIEIFSLNGDRLLKSNSSNIDISFLEAGLYVCKRSTQSQLLIKL